MDTGLFASPEYQFSASNSSASQTLSLQGVECSRIALNRLFLLRLSEYIRRYLVFGVLLRAPVSVLRFGGDKIIMSCFENGRMFEWARAHFFVSPDLRPTPVSRKRDKGRR
jgi:hypothetical protein